MLLIFISAIALEMFSHISNDLFCVADSSRSNYGWRNMEKFFSAVHLPTLISKRNSKTTKEMLKNSATERSASSVHGDDDTEKRAGLFSSSDIRPGVLSRGTQLNGTA